VRIVRMRRGVVVAVRPCAGEDFLEHLDGAADTEQGLAQAGRFEVQIPQALLADLKLLQQCLQTGFEYFVHDVISTPSTLAGWPLRGPVERRSYKNRRARSGPFRSRDCPPCRPVWMPGPGYSDLAGSVAWF